jgi:ABC-type multidrug transport system permease subunit
MVKIIKNIFNDLLDQAWTLLGMFIAWVVLDGSAKVVVGYGIMMTTVIWILSSPIRHRGEE